MIIRYSIRTQLLLLELAVVLPLGLVIAEGMHAEIARDEDAARQRIVTLAQIVAAQMEERPEATKGDVEVALPEGGVWLVVDNQGQVLNAYPPSLRATKGAVIVAQAQRRPHIRAITQDFDGLSRIYCVAAIARHNWRAIVGVPTDSALKPSRYHIWRHSILLATIVVFASLLAVRCSRLIEEPIRALEAASRRLEEGNWDEEIMVNGPVELSEVAGQFNAMQKSLREAEEQRQHDEYELRQSHEQLRSLAARLEKVIEEERTRIAREIHDDLGQSLTSLKMDVVMLRGHVRASSLEPEQIGICEARLTAMANLIDDSVRRMRQLSTDLRPAVLDLGLEAAAEWLLGDFQKRTGIECELKSRLGELVLHSEQSTALFRILQEALTNVARHAEAQTVKVRLNISGDTITMQVADDGRGITKGDLAKMNSLGLVGIRERALLLGGGATWHGTPGQGTKVSVAVPLKMPTEGKQEDTIV